MKLKHKLLLATPVVGLPLAAWAATVEFRDFSDAGASIHVSGQMPGTIARLERSTDLVNWAPVDAGSVAPDGTALLSYVNAPGQPRGFYRVAAEPAPRVNAPVQMVCSQDQQDYLLSYQLSLLKDDAVPHVSYGAAYPQLDTAITPLKAGNKLVVDVEVQGGTYTGGDGAALVLGLFVNDEAGARAVAIEGKVADGVNNGNEETHALRLRYIFQAPSTAPLVCKTRVSTSKNSSAVLINHTKAGTDYGNRLTSSMTITEIQQ